MGGFFLIRLMRRLYQWVMHWADTPHASHMLGILSFAESSFFPIPPDVLLIPMAVSRPDRALRFGAITSLTSVLGGMLGYLIGLMFFDTLGIRIIEFYGVMDKYFQFREWFEEYNFAIIMVAGLTPLPYKVFTITAGVAEVNFPVFVLGSVLSRTTRFMAESAVCYYGDFFSKRIFKMPIREALDRYINLFAISMAVLGVAGFLVVKMALPGGEVHIEREVPLPGGGSGRAVFKSVPDKEVKGTFEYLLTLSANGGTMSARIPAGPFTEPSRGEAALFMLPAAKDRLVLVAVFYSELTPPQYGTDGHAVFYLVSEHGLAYLEQLDFTRYSLLEEGAWLEGRIEIAADETNGKNEILARVKTVKHPGSRGGREYVRGRCWRYGLRAGKLELIEYKEEKP